MRILPDFVETHGIDHLDVSMLALKVREDRMREEEEG